MKFKYLVVCMLSGIIVATISSNASAQGINPCAGITCHDNSKCYAIGSKAVCQCDAGYKSEVDGLSCTPTTKADPLIASGAVLTGIGGLTAIISGAIIGANYQEPVCDEYGCADYSGWGNAMIALTAFPIAGAITVTGIVLLSVGLSKRKKMERNKLAFDIKTRHGKLTLEPTVAASENGGVFGLVGRF